MELLEQIRKEIESGHVQETCELVEKALQENISADMIVNEAMLPAIRMLGERLKSETANLPLLLAAARSVRQGFQAIETNSDGYERNMIGTVILGTVEGDLHDIGKNLVGLMLRSEGFRVIDLGVDISDKQFLKAIRENPEVKIVCISSLLTTSLPELSILVRKLRNQPNRSYKIMVGGGAVTEEIARQIGADAYTDTAVDAAVLARNFMRD